MATEKLTQQGMVQILLDQNKTMIEAMNNVSDAVKAINDKNQLHADILIRHSASINANTASIKEMVSVNNSFLKLFRWIILVLIISLIVLAGAEKALKFIQLPGF